jgi:tetratricopeptide (TPR) repeat protein
MKRLLLSLMLSLSFPLLTANEPKLIDVLHQHVEAANTHANGGKHDQALQELNNALVKAPKYARAYKIRANVYFAKGDYSKALADFNTLIELAPERAQSYVDRSIVLLAMKKYSQAKADIEKAIGMDPSDSFAQTVRSRIQSEAGSK